MAIGRRRRRTVKSVRYTGTSIPGNELYFQSPCLSLFSLKYKRLKSIRNYQEIVISKNCKIMRGITCGKINLRKHRRKSRAILDSSLLRPLFTEIQIIKEIKIAILEK